MSASLLSFDVAGASWPCRALRPLSATGRKVGIEMFDRTKASRKGLFGSVTIGFAIANWLRRLAELGFWFSRPGRVLLPGVLGSLGPCRSHGGRALGNGACESFFGRRLRTQAGWLGRPIRLEPGIGRFDQSLAEAAWGRVRSIAPTFDREVGAFAVTAAVLVTVAFSSSFSRPFFKPGWGGSGRHASGRRTERFRPGRRRTAIVATTPSARITLPIAVPLTHARIGLVVRAFESFEVLRLDIRDMQEPIAADRKVDKRGLDRRFEVDDPALVDVARIALVACSLNVKLFKDAVLDDRDPAFLGLEHVDQHFFLHAVSFQDGHRLIGACVRLGNSSSRSVRVRTAPWSSRSRRASASSSSSGRAEPSADTFKRNRSSPSMVNSAVITWGRKSKVDSRLGLRRIKGQLSLDRNNCRLDCAVRRRSSRTGNVYSTVLGRGGAALAGRGWASSQSNPGGATGFSRKSSSADSSGSDSSRSTTSRRPSIPSPNARAKVILGLRVETLSQGDREFRRAQHSLQAAHDVMMADQTEIATLGESESHFGDFCHIPRTRTPH